MLEKLFLNSTSANIRLLSGRYYENQR